MPLEKVSIILRDADQHRYAVAAFNVFNLESISWIIKAAEQEDAPVIAMLYPGCSRHIPESTFNAIAKDLARKAKVPVGVHYDHSSSFEQIMTGIADGFPSVMIDGSALSFEDNIRVTAEVVRAAHPMRVDVEAELGHVGRASNIEDFIDSNHYTDPAETAEFVERTGVDSIAVAIGNAHGNYVATPHLDLKRLEEIKKAVPVPLVLHGGSGIPKDQIRGAVAHGIAKLNIGTEFGQEFYRKMKAIMLSDDSPDNMLGCLMALEDDMIAYIRSKIRLLKG